MVMPEQKQPICTIRPSDSLDALVPERVAAQAALKPPALAVSTGGRCLSRRALDTRANRLAWHVRSLGVGRDVLVGLCLPRSLELVVGALGILKAGGAYVPLDPGYPPERLAYMLENAQAPVLRRANSTRPPASVSLPS